jgi:FkbM family methyltransferase
MPSAAYVDSLLRESWYSGLEVAFRNGVPVTFADGRTAKLHPRLLGMRPAAYEPDLMRLMVEHSAPGAIVLDIGAHVGLHTLALADRVGPSGRVIAIEPSPANAGLLRFHVTVNSCHNVDVIEAIVTDHEGESPFTYRADATDPGGFANSIAYDIGGETTLVRTTTLDMLCNGISPDLIKIDVEGAELLALRGAPTVVVAIHPDPMRTLGTSPSELVSFMNALGYRGHHRDGQLAVTPGFEEIVFQKQRI